MVVFTTTCMVSIAAIICWRIHPLIVLPGFLIFALFDGLYVSSALTKIPNGAWSTLMMAIILASVALVWRYGRELEWRVTSDRSSLNQLIVHGHDGGLYLGQDRRSKLTNVEGNYQACPHFILG
jgi:KUP system potassium uptake protein